MGWQIQIPEPPNYGHGPGEFGDEDTREAHERTCTERRRNMHTHRWEVAPMCFVVTPSGERLTTGTVVRTEHFVHPSEKRWPQGIIEKLVQLGVVLESLVYSEPEPPRAA